MASEPTRKKTSKRILSAAARIFGRSGYRGASVDDVAKEAGVSKGLVHYHFHTKEKLVIAAQKATFRELHRRISERAQRGERGLSSALDALDAMWSSVRDLHEGAPFIVETFALSAQDGDLNTQMRSFYQESTALLEDGINMVFAGQLDQLTIPPRRMATLIRIWLEGLVLELAQVRNDEDMAIVDQAYADTRNLFARFVLQEDDFSIDPETDSLPLPW